MAYKQKRVSLSSPKPVSKRDQRHYWPYLPLVIVLVGLLGTLFIGNLRATQVLGSSEGLGKDTLLASTNQARTHQSEPVLRLNDSLDNAAQKKADDMVARNYWSHVTPDGKQPWSFVDATGYRYQVIGENLAYGFSSGDEVIRGWLNSPTHRENLLNNEYSDVGFGVASSPDYNHDGAETVVVALYAKPGNLSATARKGVLSARTNVANFSISRLETLAGSHGQTAVFLIGLLTGAAVIMLLVKHLAALKRIFIDSEQFVIHHPIFDVTLMVLLIIGVFLAQTVGFVR